MKITTTQIRVKVPEGERTRRNPSLDRTLLRHEDPELGVLRHYG